MNIFTILGSTYQDQHTLIIHVELKDTKTTTATKKKSKYAHYIVYNSNKNK